MLRIILCLAVFFHHYCPPYSAAGAFCVIGFFLMSGFLLGLEFQKTEVFDSSAFYSKKAVRLLPMLCFAYLFSVSMKVINEPFLLKNYTSAEIWVGFNIIDILKWPNPALWYMGVELCFLASAPLLFWLHRKKCALWVLFLASALLSGIIHSRIPLGYRDAMGFYFSPLGRIWQFVGGILLADVWRHVVENRRFMAYAMLKSKWNYVAAVLVLFILTGVLVYLLVLPQDEISNADTSFRFECMSALLIALSIPLLFEFHVNAGQKIQRCLHHLSLLTYPYYMLHMAVLNALIGPFFRKAYGYLFGEGMPYAATAFFAALLSWVLSETLLVFQKKIWG